MGPAVYLGLGDPRPKKGANVCPKQPSDVQILAVWNFGRKTPKFWFEFCREFLGGFFPPVVFPRKKARKNPPKKAPAKFTEDFVLKNSPRISAEAFSWKLSKKAWSSFLDRIVRLVHLLKWLTGTWIEHLRATMSKYPRLFHNKLLQSWQCSKHECCQSPVCSCKPNREQKQGTMFEVWGGFVIPGAWYLMIWSWFAMQFSRSPPMFFQEFASQSKTVFQGKELGNHFETNHSAIGFVKLQKDWMCSSRVIFMYRCLPG